MSQDLSAFQRFAIAKKAGEIVFCEFEPGDAFYLIQTGKIKIVKVLGGVEKTLDILQPGEFFGEMAILEEAPRSASALALTDVKLLEFNKANFDVLLQGNPQIVLSLLKIFSKRIYDQKRRFMILKLEDVQARVADVFLMLDENQGKPSDPYDNQRVFNSSVDDIAHWAGLSVTKVGEVLNHFASQRKIELLQGKILVKNIADLSRFVNTKRNKI